ncbi:MAG TPA: dolichyl-phosphate beta-glucosyltransferase [Polyangiaceae bacterium]|nr:dolichyl-phosphate beta-glucosyltransferase [Polyangiaceae bacterium]
MSVSEFDLDLLLDDRIGAYTALVQQFREAGVSAVPDVSVVIPAYNESGRILPTLFSRLDHFTTRRISHEIIVVDDGSRDSTAALVREVSRRLTSVRLICLPSNMGKGAAVRAGVRNASGELVLIEDADGATPISEFDSLQAAIERGSDIAIGSRQPSEHTRVERRLKRWIMGRTFALLVNGWAVPGIADTQCGFKLFRSDVARRIFALQRMNGFSFDVELLRIARVLGFSISEVPINWADVAGSKVNLVRDSLRMLWDVLRIPGVVRKSLQRESARALPAGAPKALLLRGPESNTGR